MQIKINSLDTCLHNTNGKCLTKEAVLDFQWIVF